MHKGFADQRLKPLGDRCAYIKFARFVVQLPLTVMTTTNCTIHVISSVSDTAQRTNIKQWASV